MWRQRSSIRERSNVLWSKDRKIKLHISHIYFLLNLLTSRQIIETMKPKVNQDNLILEFVMNICWQIRIIGSLIYVSKSFSKEYDWTFLSNPFIVIIWSCEWALYLRNHVAKSWHKVLVVRNTTCIYVKRVVEFIWLKR